LDKVRVRFAPSPTGDLHLGGARTALFNFLFARHHQGTFILRIEDTDRERSRDEYLQSILGSLKWLEIKWDEGPEVGGDYGPYFQSARSRIYQEYTQKLLAEKKAYFCLCSPERLANLKKKAQREKKNFGYDGACREKEIYSLPPDKKAVVRFKTPKEGTTGFNDLIRGKVTFENNLIDDFIIQRSDGSATYNFTVVVDDITMKISHVIRGEDHISNTAKQLLLYQALNFSPPQFAHLPLIFGKDRARLSKRHGATAVIDYQKQGFLKSALINYLALLGWTYNGVQEFFTLEELIEKFSLEKISKTAAIFDLEKLTWMNGHYIRQLPLDELTELTLPYLTEANLISDEEGLEKYSWIKEIVRLHQERMFTLSEISFLTRYFFEEEVQIEEKLWEKYLRKPGVKEILLAVREKISKNPIFEAGFLEQVIREVAAELEIGAGKVIHPVRVAISGRNFGPGLFEMMEVLGREKVFARLDKVIEKLTE
jgi:glutamyl-tRNA synthetase